MKYFTPDLITLGQSDDDAALDEVERLWDDACDRYRSYYDSIKEQLPAGLRHLHDNFYLHDSRIRSMGQQNGSFVIVLRLDTPPRDLLIFTYELAGEPEINDKALVGEICSPGPVEWMYDEVELTSTDPFLCIHSILLSNGWEIRLLLREVHVHQMKPLIPSPLADSVGASSL